MHFLLMVDRFRHRQEPGRRVSKGRVVRRAQCPVSSSDGTARPGHMSDCFFDLRACATQPCALAIKPKTEKLKLKVADILAYTLSEAPSFKSRRAVCQSRKSANSARIRPLCLAL